MEEITDDRTLKPAGGVMPDMGGGNYSSANDVPDDRTIALAKDDSTPQSGNNDNMDDTLRTLRPEAGAKGSAVSAQDDCFDLKGIVYKKVKCLSDNSGEAQVFLVNRDGKEYVLKVYYPHFSVNRKLLQIIRSFRFEMIVTVIDYGKTYVDTKSRYYELMEYLRGGTLQEYVLGDDFNQFRRIALQAASALAYCHRNHILHKDVKPSNFFFRDEDHQELVLGDFGISSILEHGGKSVRTTQARTPIYAAPEMYADVIDGEVEITPAVDFYSLGITLFALWLGETPMSANERVMMRQKNEGRLPRMGELPDNVKVIVQGLTAVNPDGRWGYDEVERWFLGENVKVDISSPVLRYKSFIVDPERNLVADNVHELIPLLLDNERLAMNYLYGGRITSWLESCGNQKLSTLVKDITANRYPAQPKVGLMAAIYAMEPTYLYRDLKGNLCDDVHSVSLSLLGCQKEYALALQNPYDNLFLWLEVHTKCDIDRLRSYFKADADAHVVIMRMVYEIDPDIPFLSRHPSDSVKDIVHSFGYNSPTEDDWHSLVDGRMLSWLYSHEDAVACESLRILTDGQPFSETLAYKVLYNLDKNVAYDLRMARKPEEVGEVIAGELMSAQHMSDCDLEKSMREVTSSDGRFHYYAQMHGWHEQIAEAHHCFDLQSEENRDRMGIYDLRTALYRFCRILGTNPKYLLPDGTELSNGRTLPRHLSQHITAELRSGSLSQWLAAYYHEDPHRNFSEEYSYERELVNWIEAIGRYDEKNVYFRRYTKACDENREHVAYVRAKWKKANGQERLLRYFFYGLCAAWLFLLIVVGVSRYGYLVNHPYLAVLLPVGGMCGVIMTTRAYFKGYGATVSALWGGVGVLSSLIPIYIIRQVEDSMPGLTTAVIAALTLIYIAVCHFTDFRRKQNTDEGLVGKVLDEDDVNTALLEPLYYTFKSKSVRYKSSKTGLLDDVDNQVHSLAGETLIHYALWSLMVLILIVQMLAFSPQLFNVNEYVEKPLIED